MNLSRNSDFLLYINLQYKDFSFHIDKKKSCAFRKFRISWNYSLFMPIICMYLRILVGRLSVRLKMIKVGKDISQAVRSHYHRLTCFWGAGTVQDES